MKSSRILGLIIATCGLTPTLAAVQYTIQPLPGTGASTISDQNVVTLDTNKLWFPSAPAVFLESGPFALSAALSISPSSHVSGFVVGRVYGETNAAVWQGNHLSLLPRLAPTPTDEAALDINDSGHAVGYSGSGNAQHAVFWGPIGPQDLSIFLNPANGPSRAVSINSSDHLLLVQGASSFLYAQNAITPINVVGRPITKVTANVINGADAVAGAVELPDGSTLPFFWSEGQAKIVNALDPNQLAKASFENMNDAGLSVGTSQPLDKSPASAVLWTGTGPLLDLNTLIDPTSGWYLYAALGVNNQGSIVGNGLLNGNPTAFLLTPIPEPATLGLISLLFLQLLSFRKRRPSATPSRQNIRRE